LHCVRGCNNVNVLPRIPRDSSHRLSSVDQLWCKVRRAYVNIHMLISKLISWPFARIHVLSATYAYRYLRRSGIYPFDSIISFFCTGCVQIRSGSESCCTPTALHFNPGYTVICGKSVGERAKRRGTSLSSRMDNGTSGYKHAAYILEPCNN
jgi:hypothetical protein